MRLTVRDVAALLNVTEKTVYRWITQGSIPAYRINDQYRFNQAELLEWATSRKINISPEIYAHEENSLTPLPSLSEAIKSGGLFYRVEGKDRDSVLHEVVEHTRLPERVDKEFLLRVLLARERLASTGIGEGVAIPHVRNPIVLHVTRPVISLCFLDRAVDFGSLDGKPVTALFTLISPTIRAHLHLLTRLIFALRDPELQRLIRTQGLREEILGALIRIESALVRPTLPDCPLV